MGTLIVTEFTTLDGIAQAPGAPDEDRDGGFVHGGWQAPVIDNDSGAAMFEAASRMDALLIGRKTYEIFSGYWPTAPDDIPFTGLLNRVPKYVASRTLSRSEPLSWNNSTLVDDLAALKSVKERHGEVHVIGSLDLVQTLLRERLVDRLELWVYPLVLGTGKRVFGDGAVPAALRLTESRTWPKGTVQLTYEATGGEPAYGDMTTAS